MDILGSRRRSMPLGEYVVDYVHHQLLQYDDPVEMDYSELVTDLFWETFRHHKGRVYLHYNSGQYYFEGLREDGEPIYLYEHLAFIYKLDPPPGNEPVVKILGVLQRQNKLLCTISNQLSAIYMATVKEGDQNGENRIGRSKIEKQPDTTKHTCVSEGTGTEGGTNRASEN